ncbi:MAG: DUF4160 domain-containing protein [Deltaproteobacteria bacterium]|nr:DUF4160 domain-containing protein [Deltaproteobacteria bacterium]
MPVISRFFGIVISMYWNDHLPPHFHAKYGEYEITVNIETGRIEGEMSERALKLILEWHNRHKEALMKNWELCRNKKMIKKIKPLE